MLFGLIALAALLAVSYLVTRPAGPIITRAEFSLSTITPNADGVTDVTQISYRIRRPATVSIFFEGSDGAVYHFRTGQVRPRGDYRVLFSGVVDGYVKPGEQPGGEVLARLLSDGTYTWVIEAVDQHTGVTDRVSGTLIVQDADSVLPALIDFSISPAVFTPNQDGLNDLIWVNVDVPKPATIQVSLLDAAGQQYFIPESQEGRKPGEEGRHTFVWDGGVDMGRTPPPDGSYQVLAVVSDAEGQRVQAVGQVTIKDGGVPLAEIVGQPLGDTVRFSSETVLVGEVLYFELTVENYGDAPIRTTGPEPGYVYDQDELYSSTGYYPESGAWRVGIHCDTCITDFPWRWALGTPETLTPIESNGRVHYYLMPGQRAVITGGIRLHNIVEARNPQEFWAGLIHEDVGVAEVNQRVDPHWIKIEEPGTSSGS